MTAIKTNHQLVDAYLFTERQHRREWETTIADAVAAGDPNPLLPAYRATTRRREVLQELEAEIEDRTSAPPCSPPSFLHRLLTLASDSQRRSLRPAAPRTRER